MLTAATLPCSPCMGPRCQMALSDTWNHTEDVSFRCKYRWSQTRGNQGRFFPEFINDPAKSPMLRYVFIVCKEDNTTGGRIIISSGCRIIDADSYVLRCLIFVFRFPCLTNDKWSTEQEQIPVHKIDYSRKHVGANFPLSFTSGVHLLPR